MTQLGSEPFLTAPAQNSGDTIPGTPIPGTPHNSGDTILIKFCPHGPSPLPANRLNRCQQRLLALSPPFPAVTGKIGDAGFLTTAFNVRDEIRQRNGLAVSF